MSGRLEIETLKKRRDFVAASRARKAATKGFILQKRPRGDEDSRVRVGFTASKKVGGAVVRNRAKRRLRSLAAEIFPLKGEPGCDYVLIARNGATVEREFAKLRADLEQALRSLDAVSPKAVTGSAIRS